MDQELISLYQRFIGCSIEELAMEILDLAKRVSSDSKVIYRVKSPETLDKKMVLKKVRSIFDIHDVYALRVLTSSVEESYEILAVVTKAFPCFLDHDYIKNPKYHPDEPNLDERSLRLIQVIAYRSNTPFEIQITTLEFNEINESFHDQYHREKYH